MHTLSLHDALPIWYLNIKKFSKNDISLVEKYKIIFKKFFLIYRDNLEYKNKTNLKNYKNLVMSYFFSENLINAVL